MATNTDAKYHYSIASALQSVCQSEYKYSCQDNIMLLQNVVFMSAMMSRISIHIHSVVHNLLRKLTKGRHRKQGKKPGRPFNGSSQSIANGILRNAPVSWKSATSLSPSQFLPSN